MGVWASVSLRRKVRWTAYCTVPGYGCVWEARGPFIDWPGEMGSLDWGDWIWIKKDLVTDLMALYLSVTVISYRCPHTLSRTWTLGHGQTDHPCLASLTWHLLNSDRLWLLCTCVAGLVMSGLFLLSEQLPKLWPQGNRFLVRLIADLFLACTQTQRPPVGTVHITDNTYEIY